MDPDGLRLLQRRLDAADSIGTLYAVAAENVREFCGYQRAIVLSVRDGLLRSEPGEALADAASDELRRTLLERPLPLVPRTAEAEAIRRAEGAKRARHAPSGGLEKDLELDRPVFGALAPGSRALALLVADRPVVPTDHTRFVVFAHLTGLALGRVIVTDRMRSLSEELRYQSASTQALMREALHDPLELPADVLGDMAFRAVNVTAEPGVEWSEVLSDREFEIARLLAAGRTNKEIGTILMLSPETVKSHVARILSKLGASNRVQAATRFLSLSDASPT